MERIQQPQPAHLPNLDFALWLFESDPETMRSGKL
jgi:hypothetical protein